MEEINALNKGDLSVSDIQAMKVTDLRRELKARGFPTTGNKTELADRLLTAFTLPKSADTSESCDDVNEDEVLGDDVLLQDDVKSQDISEEEIFGSPLKETTKSNGAMPKSKEDGSEVKQKIQLTRTLKSLPSITKKESSHQRVSMAAPKVDEVKKMESAAVTKPISQAERLELRAKRFKLDDSEQSKTASVKTSSTTASAKITSNVTATVSQLKKRAERFGQNISSVMKQVEEKERLLKRKARFGQTIVAPTANEETLKKTRLERFGLRQ